MNVFDTIQALRPDVDPMPMAERRRIRERLFGVGHDDSTRSIRARSESGAVVSTAPHGIRRPVRARPRRRGSLTKVAAGLLVISALGVLAWSFVNQDDETVTTAEPEPSTTSAAPTTTPPPPSTEAPFVRTGVTDAAPLVLPASLLTVDSVSIAPASGSDATALFNAPDGASLWMAEVDGDESGAFGLEILPYGTTVAIGIDPSREEDSLTSYRPVVDCGFVLVHEGIAQPYDRAATIEFFTSMSIDNQGTIDVNLPVGWSMIDVGPVAAEYTTVFRIPNGDAGASDGSEPAGETDDAEGGGDDASTGPGGDDLVSLRQIPGGSISQFAGNGQRLGATTLLDGPAYVDLGPLDPSIVTYFWRDGDTVFEASSSTLDAQELATFIDGLEPATIDDFELRFSSTTPPEEPRETDCIPQPHFGSTFDP